MQQTAIDALSRIGQPAVPALVNLLDEPEPTIACRGRDCAGSHWPRGARCAAAVDRRWSRTIRKKECGKTPCGRSGKLVRPRHQRFPRWSNNCGPESRIRPAMSTLIAAPPRVKVQPGGGRPAGNDQARTTGHKPGRTVSQAGGSLPGQGNRLASPQLTTGGVDFVPFSLADLHVQSCAAQQGDKSLHGNRARSAIG